MIKKISILFLLTVLAEVSYAGPAKDFVIGQSFSRGSVDGDGIALTQTITFNSEHEAEFSQICHFSRSGAQEDVRASVKAKIKIDDLNYSILEGKFDKQYTRDGTRFCTAVAQLVNDRRYVVVSETQVIFYEDVWTRKGTRSSEQQDKLVQSRGPLPGKKWLFRPPSNNGINVTILYDLTTVDKMRAEVTCEYRGETIGVNVETSYETTEDQIINRIASAHAKKQSANGFFCGAMIPVRRMSYRVVSDAEVVVTGDPMLPGEQVWRLSK